MVLKNKNNLDTSVLDISNSEQSLTQMSLTFVSLLNAHQATNHHLYAQVQQSAYTQQQNTAAVQEFTDINIKCNYDHIFTSAPIFNGSKRCSKDVLRSHTYKVEKISVLKHLLNQEVV